MTEEATTKRQGRPAAAKADEAKTLTDVKPDSYGPSTSGMGEIMSSSEVKDSGSVLADLVMGFIMFRRAQVYSPRLGGNIGGAAAIEAAKTATVLAELEAFVNWLRDGSPTPQQRISESDKDFYRAAVAKGLTVPEEIKRQL